MKLHEALKQLVGAGQEQESVVSYPKLLDERHAFLVLGSAGQPLRLRHFRVVPQEQGQPLTIESNLSSPWTPSLSELLRDDWIIYDTKDFK